MQKFKRQLELKRAQLQILIFNYIRLGQGFYISLHNGLPLPISAYIIDVVSILGIDTMFQQFLGKVIDCDNLDPNCQLMGLNKKLARKKTKGDVV